MSRYKFSDKIKLEPWVGSKYYTQPIKIMVLGLSCYGPQLPHESSRVAPNPQR
jgi:hypothetical protein